jgi:hypothetical protein
MQVPVQVGRVRVVQGAERRPAGERRLELVVIAGRVWGYVVVRPTAASGDGDRLRCARAGSRDSSSNEVQRRRRRGERAALVLDGDTAAARWRGNEPRRGPSVPVDDVAVRLARRVDVRELVDLGRSEDRVSTDRREVRSLSRRAVRDGRDAERRQDRLVRTRGVVDPVRAVVGPGAGLVVGVQREQLSDAASRSAHQSGVHVMPGKVSFVPPPPMLIPILIWKNRQHETASSGRSPVGTLTESPASNPVAESCVWLPEPLR